MCYLAGNWRILQLTSGHRWSLDDLVTAWFAASRCDGAPPERIMDLGCGIGSVLLMLAWRFPHTQCVGIEVQAVSVGLARRSLVWNGADTRCAVRHGDLRDLNVLPERRAYTLVTGTPPYLVPGKATEPAGLQQRFCHIEHHGGIDAYCQAAARVMAPGGCFVTCYGAQRVADVGRAAARAGLAVEAYIDVVPRRGKPALFSVFSMRHAARAGSPCELPPLVVRDHAGRRTDAFCAVRHSMGMPP